MTTPGHEPEPSADDDPEPDATIADTSRPPSPAAAAPNWRTVVAVDVGLGAFGILVGMVLAVAWLPVAGAGLASVALVYAVLAIRRGRQWSAWRRSAGLG
jgi:hypothetical protein